MRASLLVACIRAISGAQPRWASLPPSDRQCIYFANHTSHLDAVVLWASLHPDLRRRTRPVAAKDYWDASALRRYLANEVFHAVLIDRTKVTSHNNPIEKMIEAMADAYSLIIFPEGTRGSGEGVGEFKSGIFHLAKQKPEAALIPVFIENLNRVLPKGEFLPVPLLCSINFGSPLSRVPGETKEEFLTRARAAVLSLDPNHHTP